MGGYSGYSLEKENNGSYSLHNGKEDTVEILFLHDFATKLAEIHLGEWESTYSSSRFNRMTLDGSSWDIQIIYDDETFFRAFEVFGENTYPYNFQEFLDVFGLSYSRNEKFE